MRIRFDDALDKLSGELTAMGELCEAAISAAARALIAGNVNSEDISHIKADIDQKERDIESLCMKLLLRQQPVAGDLRQISAALKMITDMERIGDQAADIADIVASMSGRAWCDKSSIGSMADAAIKMVTESVNAYVRQDVALASWVVEHDDVVDGLFDDVKAYVIALTAKNPTDGEFALDLLMIAKYFERIGDHAVNIAEWVIYSITGIHNGVSR